MRTVVAMVATVSLLAVPELAEASISELNQQRAAAGLPPLTEDPGLTILAQQQSAQMAASADLTHSTNLGAEVGSVAPGFLAAAENIGYGQSVSSVTNTFMTSPTHRSAILGNFNAAGVGVVVGGDGRVWVTQVFARVGAARVSPVVRSVTVRRTSSRRSARVRKRCSVVRGKRRCRYVRIASRRAVPRSARVHRHRHRHRR